MKFCQKCGKELVDEAVICTHCGCSVGSSPINAYVADAPNLGLAILSFFIPLVGLILYLVNKDSSPLKAKSAGKGALIGFCVNMAFYIIFGVIYGILIATLL